jgi:peptidoglycan hydrolase CwlO-like protein
VKLGKFKNTLLKRWSVFLRFCFLKKVAIIFNMTWKKKTKNLAIFLIVLWLVAFDVRSFRDIAFAADDADDIKDDIEKVEDKKEAVEKALSASQILLQKKNAELGTTKTLLQKTQEEIARKEAEVTELEKRIALNREMLRDYMQEAYYADQDPLTNLLLGGVHIAGMSGDFDQTLNVSDKITSTLSEIKTNKADVEQAQNELGAKKEDHEKLITIQQGQQYEIKTDINQAQATLSELNAKIDKLKSELSSLLSESVSFKNVIDAASFAAKKTRIRKDYLLGVLVVESNLGRYTGGCTADKSKMSSYRLGIFKTICSELDYEWKKRKVSCPPSGYTGTGGAMGVAQFMSDTWAGYKSSIASVTGNNPPDPWSLTDGVVAMALKLTKVDGVKQHKKSAEAKAYCVYLAGGNWASYCDSKGVNYGEKVLYWADNYERVME